MYPETLPTFVEGMYYAACVIVFIATVVAINVYKDKRSFKKSKTAV